MKNIYFLFILVSLFLFKSNTSNAQTGDELVEICALIANDATYLKDFKVQLDAAKPGERPPFEMFTLILSKNTIYRFSVCNSKDFGGKAILQVYDNNRLLASTHNIATGKDYPAIDIQIQKTGSYHVRISFKNGESGLAVGILSYVSRF